MGLNPRSKYFPMPVSLISLFTPEPRATGPTAHKSTASVFESFPTPHSLFFTEASSKKTLVSEFTSFLRDFMVFSTSFCISGVMSFLNPPTLHIEKITLPPVIFSNRSRTFSRSLQQCINKLSNPSPSASRPNHRRWL